MVRDERQASVPSAGRTCAAGVDDRSEQAQDTQVAGKPTGENRKHTDAQRLRSSEKDHQDTAAEATGRRIGAVASRAAKDACDKSSQARLFQ